MAASVTRSLSDSGVELMVPVGTLVVFAVAAVVAGVLAAMAPARRASRLDVLCVFNSKELDRSIQRCAANPGKARGSTRRFAYSGCRSRVGAAGTSVRRVDEPLARPTGARRHDPVLAPAGRVPWAEP